LTIVEKIIASHFGKKSVSPGEFVSVKVDLVMATDCTGPLAINQFRRIGVKKIFDPSKIVMIPDHFVPNKDIASAEQSKQIREFAYEQGTHYYELGQGIRTPVPAAPCVLYRREWDQRILLMLWPPGKSG
jgi:3-isopropylmalate/(R)-2-methylmalate dehydratase large subunit